MFYDVEANRWSGGPGRKGRKRILPSWLPPPGYVAIGSALAKTAWSVAKSAYSSKRYRNSPKAKRALEYGTSTAIEVDEKPGAMDQSTGLRRRVLRPVSRRVKRFSNLKLLKNNTINVSKQQLGVQQGDGAWSTKQPVSEYNPNSAGFFTIAKSSSQDSTPMHVYDLSHVQFHGIADNDTNFPVNAIANQCNNTNARAWRWQNTNEFVQGIYRPTLDNNIGGGGMFFPRYYVNDPRGDPRPYLTAQKVYMKSIVVDFMAYGAKNMPTEFDFRVIKITDPRMCPDYRETLSAKDLEYRKQCWANEIRSWTINPMLRGIEPGPKAIRPWYKVVAKKRFMIGEQTADLDCIPTVQGKLYVDVNTLKDMRWDNEGFTATESGDAAYDQEYTIDDNGSNINVNTEHRPHPMARYYLVIRALSPVDVSSNDTVNQDQAIVINGTNIDFKYCPTYDLNIRVNYLSTSAGVAPI